MTDNTPSEIKDTFVEMDLLLMDKLILDQEDKKLQKIFGISIVKIIIIKNLI